MAIVDWVYTLPDGVLLRGKAFLPIKKCLHTVEFMANYLIFLSRCG